MSINKPRFSARLVDWCLAKTVSALRAREFLLSDRANDLWQPDRYKWFSETLLDALLKVAVLTPISNGRPDFGEQFLALLQVCQASISTRLSMGGELPVALEEAALRLALLQQPEDIELTYSLISLLVRTGRSPLPDSATTLSGHHQGDDAEDKIIAVLKETIRLYECNNDTFGIHAALWQMVVRLPNSGRGWAELAWDAAKRGNYPDALAAIGWAKSLPCSTKVVAVLAEAAVKIADSSTKVPEDAIARIESQARYRGDGFLLEASQYLYHQSGNHDKAGKLTAFRASSNSATATELLLRAKNAYYRDDFSAMYSCLRLALERDPVPIWHDIVRSFSGQTSITLEKIGKYDELADWFSAREELVTAINLIPPFPNSSSAREALQLREQALANGLPPALLVTQAKSGSVSVGAIFNHGFNLPTVTYGVPIGRVVLPWAKDFARGGGCHTTHMWGTERNVDLLVQAGIKKVMVHVRDPRQVLLSRVHHYRRYQSGNTQDFNQSFQSLAMESQVDFMAKLEFEKIVRWIENWVDASRQLDVRFTTFEEFTRDRDVFFDTVLKNYGADTRYFNKQAAIQQHAGIDYHFRKGETDEWRRVFTPRQIDAYNARIPNAFWQLFDWNP